MFFPPLGGGGHLRLESSGIKGKYGITHPYLECDQSTSTVALDILTVFMVFLISSRNIPAFIIPTYYSALILLYTLCVWDTNKCYKINHKKIYFDDGDGRFHGNVSTDLPDYTKQELEDSNPQGDCESQISQALVCTIASHIK